MKLQNKRCISINNSLVDLKSLERSDGQHKKSFLKCCLSNTDDGMQHNSLWDNSESSDQHASTSKYNRSYSGVSQQKHQRSILIK
jgi:hypothetical protein